MMRNLAVLSHQKRTRALKVKLRSSTATQKTKNTALINTLNRKDLNFLVREAIQLTNKQIKKP